MPRKSNSRRLWLKVKFDAPGASNELVLQTLLQSIKNGTYEYPRGWRVALGWSNEENGAMKWGEWTKEMTASAASSEGFDFAVQSYLDSMLEAQ